MNFRRVVKAACVLGLLAAALGTALPARAQALSDKAAKVERLMRADGYNYINSKSASVWSIHFTGKSLSDIKVILAVSEESDSDLMVIFVTVAEKKRLPVTTDFMRKLLEENHEFDRVKVGFDADGDLFVRADASLRVLDEKEFKSIVDQVEKASDELYGNISSMLN